MIGDEIVATISSVDGQSAKLGTEAPAEVLIYREELYRKIKVEPAKTPSIIV